MITVWSSCYTQYHIKLIPPSGNYANYGTYPDQPPTSYTTYAPPPNGYGSYGAEVKGKKVARSADDYGTEFHALLNITSN
jgi:hypothetical protein